jgi:hypothetical protein
MYQARVLELKQLILAEETRFRSILVYYLYPVFWAYLFIARSVAAEIEAIRAGKWDTQIEKRLDTDEYATDKTAPASPSEVCLFYYCY